MVFTCVYTEISFFFTAGLILQFNLAFTILHSPYFISSSLTYKLTFNRYSYFKSATEYHKLTFWYDTLILKASFSDNTLESQGKQTLTGLTFFDKLRKVVESGDQKFQKSAQISTPKISESFTHQLLFSKYFVEEAIVYPDMILNHN